MKLNEFTAQPGATKVAYRKGRGAGSGSGKTAGRAIRTKIPFWRRRSLGF